MNKNKDPLLRALYIVLIPVVILIIVLNSGMLQKMVPAARVHGQNYTVVRYNYYYFDYYNTFLEEHEYELDELGYDPNVSDTSQYTADGVSWKVFFMRQAEANMAETAYYCDLAREAGYEFSQEELLPVREKLAANAAVQTASNINAKNFYTAYYGAGATEANYTAELTRQVQAQAYKEYLIRSAAPAQAEIDAYIAENHIPDYRTVNLRVITLDALPDRETGEVGLPQIIALNQRVTRLLERYEAGESFEELQAAFSTKAFGDSQGYLLNATRLDMPEMAAAWCLGDYYPAESVAWCLGDYESVGAGSVGALVDSEEGRAYLLILDGYSGSGPEREAALALGQDELLARAASEIAASFKVERLRFGMLLATA